MSTYKIENIQSTSLVDDTDKNKIVKFDLTNITSGNTKTITIPDSNLEMVGRTTVQTLTNKTIDGSVNTLSNVSAAALTGTLNANQIADGSVSNVEFQRISSLASNAVGESDPQTLTNKTFVDSSTIFEDNVDSTKKGQFDLTNVAPGNIRKYDLPDADTRLVGHNNNETLTNKVISATLNTISNIGNTEIQSLAGIDANKIANGAVNNTKFQYLQNLTSDIQTQIDNHTHIPSEVGLSNVSNLKMNLNATVTPGINNDTTDGYSVGSRWVVVSANEEYVCTDATDGAANWQLTTALSGGGAGGEANTMANVGSTGIGLYINKTAVQFRMKNINSTSARLSMTDNTGQGTLDLDVVESSININNLTGAPTGALVGDSDIQTLTNKTIAAGSNTITGLTKSDIGLTNVQNIKVNLAALTDPGLSDDSNSGYSIGSRWINMMTNQEYVCTYAAAGSANWVETTNGTGGATRYSSSTTDPTGSVNSGDDYFNSIIREMMHYDGTRGKWLSTSMYTEIGGNSGNTRGGDFYKRNAMTMSLTTGPYIPKGTIVAIGFGCDNATDHTLEIYIDGSLVTSLPSNGATTGYTNTINVDFNGGKLAVRNAFGSNTVSNMQYTIWFRNRP